MPPTLRRLVSSAGHSPANTASERKVND